MRIFGVDVGMPEIVSLMLKILGYVCTPWAAVTRLGSDSALADHGQRSERTMHHEAYRFDQSIRSQKISCGHALWIGESMFTDRSCGPSRVNYRNDRLCSRSPLMKAVSL